MTTNTLQNMKGLYAIKKMVLSWFYRHNSKAMTKDMMDFVKRDPSLNNPVEGEDNWAAFWSRFGVKPSLLFYRVYSRYIGNNVNIVPMDISRNYIEPILNPGWSEFFYNDKNVFGLLFDRQDLPITYFRSIGGKYYDNNYNPLLKDDLIKSFNKAQKVVVKPVRDLGGRGVTIYKLSNDGLYYDSDNNSLSISLLERSYGKDFLIQEYFCQSDYLSQFNPTSVNTIRMNTYRDVNTGEIHILGAVLRIGQQGSVVDNATAGGVFVGINKDGKLGGYSVDHHGNKKKQHNGIDFSISDFVIPNYAACKELAITITKRMPHLSLFAHDIALDKNNNPKLIEVNTHYLTSFFLQTTAQPLFGDYADDIIEFCLKNKGRMGFGWFTTFK